MSRRATDSVTFFSSRPAGPFAPSSVPPCPASTTMTRSAPGGARSMSGGISGGAGCAGAGTGAGVSVVRPMTSTMIRPAPRSPAASVALKVAKPEPSSIARDAGPSGLTAVTRSGAVEAGSAASSMSASNRTRSLDPSCTTVCGVCRRHIKREPCRRSERFHAPDDARRADVADQNQSRRLPQFDAGAQRRSERPRHEVDRHEPGASLANRGGGQREQPAVDRREALAWRQDDCLCAGRDRQAAGRRIFTNDDAEERRQIVQCEHLLAAQQSCRERSPTITRQHGIGSRRRRLGGRSPEEQRK